MDQHYRAFISYKHAPADNVVAAEIQKRLERYHVPAAIRKKTGRDKIGRIFRDKVELPITSDLSDDIGKALEDADFLIVICSTSTKLSAWVPREIAAFLKHHSKKNVLTVLVDGEPGDVIPEMLRTDTVTRTAPDGTPYEEDVIYEPLSCDFRVGIKEARRTEIPRLAAALLGCTYDELVMRERQYKRRRNLAIGIPAACMLTVAISYLIWSRQEIAKNYQRAEENYQLAQQNYQLAEENYQKAEENYQLAQENYREAQANLDRALINQSDYLSSESEKLLNKGDRIRAILLALEALPGGDAADRPLTASSQGAMVRALRAYCAPGTADKNHSMTTVAEFGMDGSISDYKGTHDGRYVIIRDSYGNVGVWDVAELTRTMLLDSEEIHDVQMLSDTRIATLGENGVAVYDLPSGRELWRFSDEETRWYRSALCVPDEGGIVWTARATNVTNPDYTTSYGMKMTGLDASTGAVLTETVMEEDGKELASFERAVCSDDGRWAAAAAYHGYYGKDTVMRVFLCDAQTASFTEVSLNRDYWRVDTMRFVPDAGNGRTEQSGAEDALRLAVMAYPLETYGMGGQNSLMDLYTEVQPMEIAVSCYDIRGALLWANSFETPQVPKLPNGKALLFSEEAQAFVSVYANRAAVIRASDGTITDQVETTNSVVSCGINGNGSLILFLDNGSLGVYGFDEPGTITQISYADFDIKSMTFINRIGEDSIDFLVVPDARRVWLYRAVYDEEFYPYPGGTMPQDTTFQKELLLGDTFVVQDYASHLYLFDLTEQSEGHVVTFPGQSYSYDILGADEEAGIVWIYYSGDDRQFLAVDTSDGTVHSYRSRYKSIYTPRLTRDGRITYWSYDYPDTHLIIASAADGILEESVLADSPKSYSRYDIRPDLKYAAVNDYTKPLMIMDLTSGKTETVDDVLRDSVRQVVWQGADLDTVPEDGFLAVTDGYDAAILRTDGSVVARLSQTGAAVVSMTGYRDELIVLFGGGLLTRYSWADGTMTGRTSLEYYASESFNEDVDWDFEQDRLYLIRHGFMSAMHIIDLETWEQEAFAQYGLGYDAARDRIVSYLADDDGKHVGYFRHYSVEDLRRKAQEALHGSTLTEEERDMYGLRNRTEP